MRVPHIMKKILAVPQERISERIEEQTVEQVAIADFRQERTSKEIRAMLIAFPPQLFPSASGKTCPYRTP